MDFAAPDGIAATLERVRAIMRDHVVPLERRYLAEPFPALEPAIEAARDAVRSAGLWAPQIPAEYGGMGLTLLEFAFVSEELGRSPLGHYVFNCQAPDAGNMEILLHHGSDEQRERFLRPLAAGRVRSCFAMTEPDRAGSNPTWLDTRAVRDGDEYVVSGRKWFTSGADGASFAVVMAITNPDAARPHERASQIVVPTDTPGYRLVRNVPVMGHAGSGYPTHAELELDGCRVPVANRLGAEGAGFALAQDRLGPGRIHHCMRWVGICERAFELMCERAARRELAPDDPLATRQIVQEWVAEARAEIDAARLLVLRAAWAMDAHGAKAARDEISIVKFFAAGVMQRVLDRAIQVHGALGVTDDTPLAYWYRHERGARIYDGADEVHKTTVARRILARYAPPRA
jgi:alkylation response protein AidB-like acyl-CoA dehydrogenase